MVPDRELLHAILRQDLASFVRKCFHTVAPNQTYLDNWHVHLIAWRLQQVAEGRIRRLLITLPPRHLKSICSSVAFPAWMLGRDPSRRIICASYSNELTAKHARDCRAIMAADWYRDLYRNTRIDPGKDAELEFMTTDRGFRLGTSVGGTLTGRGGNLIIIDDPMKAADATSEVKREAVTQWYDGTLYSRLDNKAEDAIVIIMQRLHVDDLAGHVLGQEDWVHIDIPAIAEVTQTYATGEACSYLRQAGEVLHEAREPRAILEQIRANLGTYDFNAQYQQCPMPVGGGLIKWAWFQTYRELPPAGADDEIVQSWDTASKAEELNDYSACTTWLIKNKQYYLIDVLRARLDYPTLRKRVIEHARRHKTRTVLIEDAGSGTQLLQDLRAASDLRPIGRRPEGDKVTRMSAQSAKIEAGYVHIPEQASWLPEFQTELLQFPKGRYDDQVDSMSQFLRWAQQHAIPIPAIWTLPNPSPWPNSG